MSADHNAAYYRRVAEEMAEADESRNRAQAQLDRWWQLQRDFETEISDTYMVGGFLERWSSTPSYTKGMREPDWRIK
jgi:1,2-phenylacetyl-CoA epoxidase catalytic subunit